MAVAIWALLDVGNVLMNCPAVEAGLALPEAGGETFVSFDKKAVTLLFNQGEAAQLST
ncbi:MAG: hypothetical protein ABF593_09505 [Acetobacter papayae]|uniref:hypothetical protein n=1 Tax=Acetobacter papayae TaxID=1076592 RepID=UPI0039E8EECF